MLCSDKPHDFTKERGTKVFCFNFYREFIYLLHSKNIAVKFNNWSDIVRICDNVIYSLKRK